MEVPDQNHQLIVLQRLQGIDQRDQDVHGLDKAFGVPGLLRILDLSQEQIQERDRPLFGRLGHLR